MKIFFLFAALLNQIIDRSIFALMTLHSAGQLNNFVRLDIESSLSFSLCFTQKHATSLWCLSLLHYAGQHSSFWKKCRSGGEPLVTLCPIWPARDLDLWPAGTKTSALPLDQLPGLPNNSIGWYVIAVVENYWQNYHQIWPAREHRRSPIEIPQMIKIWQKSRLFFHFQFLLAFFGYNSNQQQYW